MTEQTQTDHLLQQIALLVRDIALPLERPSLRDRFAMAAMQGDLATQSVQTGVYRESVTVEGFKNRAKLYYRMADAMLEVRDER